MTSEKTSSPVNCEWKYEVKWDERKFTSFSPASLQLSIHYCYVIRRRIYCANIFPFPLRMYFPYFHSETETSGPVNGGRSEINQYLDSYSIRASKIIFISIFFTTLSMLQSKWRFSHRRVPKFFLLSSFHLDVHNRIFGWQMLQQSWRRELFFYLLKNRSRQIWFRTMSYFFMLLI